MQPLMTEKKKQDFSLQCSTWKVFEFDKTKDSCKSFSKIVGFKVIQSFVMFRGPTDRLTNRQTDGPTDRPTDLGIKAPSRSLK